MLTAGCKDALTKDAPTTVEECTEGNGTIVVDARRSSYSWANATGTVGPPFPVKTPNAFESS